MQELEKVQFENKYAFIPKLILIGLVVFIGFSLYFYIYSTSQAIPFTTIVAMSFGISLVGLILSLFAMPFSVSFLESGIQFNLLFSKSEIIPYNNIEKIETSSLASSLFTLLGIKSIVIYLKQSQQNQIKYKFRLSLFRVDKRGIIVIPPLNKSNNERFIYNLNKHANKQIPINYVSWWQTSLRQFPLG